MTLSKTWTMRCPEGHSNWRANSEKFKSAQGTYYCQSCGEHFDELHEAPRPSEPAWKGEVILR